MTDRELLEAAADVIGLPPLKFIGTFVGYWDASREGKGIGCNVPWNPLADTGDRYRLAQALGMVLDFSDKHAHAVRFWVGAEEMPRSLGWDAGDTEAEARAIVTAAAALAPQVAGVMPEKE